MKQLHDSKIGWQTVKRNLDRLNILTADKGHDWWPLRQRPRSEGVKPAVKPREFGWHGIANDLLQDDSIYHQRSNAESTFSPFAANTARSFELKRGSDSSANSS